MPIHADAAGIRGFHVNTVDGHRLGRVEGVYPDGNSQEPEWAAVATGLFGTGPCLLPLSALDWTDVGSELTVALTRDQIIGAPRHPIGAVMTTSDELKLAAYYAGRGLTHAG